MTGNGFSTVQYTLAERWNGSTWSFQTMPHPVGAVNSYLNAVSCPSANACIAVGATSPASGEVYSLIERWDGKAWSIQTPAADSTASLQAVACSKSNACTAVGYDSSGPMAERWNGHAWVLQTPVIPTDASGGQALGAFSSVSCPASNLCLAAGRATYPSLSDDRPLAER